MVQVTETARFRPGKCALSGETQGPFIDTERSIPRYGRVYISIKWLREPLRELGFYSEDEVDEILEDNKNLQREVDRLEAIESDHRELVDAVTPYLPTPEPEIREIPVDNNRAPTDEEIARWIEEKGGNHPVVRNARPAERGSAEEWRELYGDVPPGHPQFSKAPTAGRETTEPQHLANQDEGGVVEVEPPNVHLIFDQEVDLDEVLSQNVGDVVAFAEGKGDEFEAALVRREFYISEKDGRDVRKGVLQPLGYWDDEDNEPLMPLDEADESDETTTMDTTDDYDEMDRDELVAELDDRGSAYNEKAADEDLVAILREHDKETTAGLSQQTMETGALDSADVNIEEARSETEDTPSETQEAEVADDETTNSEQE